MPVGRKRRESRHSDLVCGASRRLDCSRERLRSAKRRELGCEPRERTQTGAIPAPLRPLDSQILADGLATPANDGFGKSCRTTARGTRLSSHQSGAAPGNILAATSQRTDQFKGVIRKIGRERTPRSPAQAGTSLAGQPHTQTPRQRPLSVALRAALEAQGECQVPRSAIRSVGASAPNAMNSRLPDLGSNQGPADQQYDFGSICLTPGPALTRRGSPSAAISVTHAHTIAIIVCYNVAHKGDCRWLP